MPILQIVPNGNVQSQLNSINTWGQALKNTISLDFNDPATTNLTVNGSNYQNIITTTFNPSSSLIQIDGNILLSTSSQSTLGVFIDNIIVQEYTLNLITKTTYGFSLKTSSSNGVEHRIDIRLKGGATKYPSTNKIQILSLIN